MLVRRVLALMLALVWFAAAWHCELEASGVMFTADHCHSAPPDTSHDHGLAGENAHTPAWSRDRTPEGQLSLLSQTLLAACFTVCLWLVARADLRTALRRPIAPPGAEPGLVAGWLFLRRCAPDVAAPPATV